VLSEHRLQVLVSIATRFAIGIYPLVFVLVFGWAYGKQAFDAAAAANNWANYLNVLLLSGFALVPPSVARLRRSPSNAADASVVRDHVALGTRLLLLGVVAAVGLWLTIALAFPALAESSGASLRSWYVPFAVLALAQLPMTLWLGVAQAAGKYGAAFVWIVGPRAISLLVLVFGTLAGLGATAILSTAVVIVIAGQMFLAHAAKHALQQIDPRVLSEPGRARRVAMSNVSAGALALLAMLVTIVPVTIIGRYLPQEVGHAQVMVMLSNGIGAVIVAAFFPLSLKLGEDDNPDHLRRHSVRVASGVAFITLALVGAAWLMFPICEWLSNRCTTSIFGVGTLVVLGAGMRLGALGPYHAALYRGRPHNALLSATVEAAAVVAITWWFLDSWMLYALGIAFVIGGALRSLIALLLETKLLAST
jgi:O-antigen/teichoic acid export membrane protein